MRLRRFREGYACIQKATEINPDYYQALSQQNIKTLLTRIGWYKLTAFVKGCLRKVGFRL